MGDVALPHVFVFAYLDPGSVSMLFQVVIGTAIAAPIIFMGYIKRGWRSIVRRLPGNREERPGDRTSP